MKPYDRAESLGRLLSPSCMHFPTAQRQTRHSAARGSASAFFFSEIGVDKRRTAEARTTRMGGFKACTSTVSAAGALLLLLAAPQNLYARADVTERATKISFREKVSLPGGSGSSLMGTGVRVKKIGPAGVKVYAVGLYVDEKAAAKELEVHKGEDGESLGKNDGFFTRVAKSNFEKTMVLKMAREVGTEKMVSALAESVKPRISGSQKPLDSFQDILLKAVGKEGAAKKGMQFGFVCKPGALCVSVNGKDAGTIKSGPLSSAMVDVYLGKKAVSPGAKKAFATGVAALLER